MKGITLYTGNVKPALECTDSTCPDILCPWVFLIASFFKSTALSLPKLYSLTSLMQYTLLPAPHKVYFLKIKNFLLVSLHLVWILMLTALTMIAMHTQFKKLSIFILAVG